MCFTISFVFSLLFFCNDSVQNLIFVSSLRALLVWWIVFIFLILPVINIIALFS